MLQLTRHPNCNRVSPKCKSQPLIDLAGTVMQIEKYIFYLNKWGKKGSETVVSNLTQDNKLDFVIRLLGKLSGQLQAEHGGNVMIPLTKDSA